MKKVIVLYVIISLFVSCSNIPNKSIFEDLSSDELATAIKSEPTFEDFYDGIHSLAKLVSFSDGKKAKYKDITYRRLFKYMNHKTDSAYWLPKIEKWGEEWDKTMSGDIAKIDDTIRYWTNYKEQNSLSRFATVTLDHFYTEYNQFIDISNSYIYFKIEPTEGPIEQIIFNVNYSYKIYEGSGKKTNAYLCPTPIKTPTTFKWKINEFTDGELHEITKDEFVQKFDYNIEITKIRKDGVNYSLEDLNIPEEISAYLYDNTEKNRDKVAKLINPKFENRVTYIKNQISKEEKEYDSECHEFEEDFLTLGNLFE